VYLCVPSCVDGRRAGRSVVSVFTGSFLIPYKVRGLIGIVKRLRTDCARFGSLQGQRILFSKMSGPAVGPTQPPIQCVPGFIPGGEAAGA
jgi:hypothetical protein